jgi:tRNA dimethylallyltransferase
MYIKALLHGIFEGPGTDAAIREKLRKRIVADGLATLHKQLTYIDPAAAEKIHANDEKRIIRAIEVYELAGKPISSFQNHFDNPFPDDWLIIGLRREKEAESRRINARVKKMIADGLIDEVKSLLAEDKPLSPQAACAIGYAEIIEHLRGNISLNDAIEKIKINTRKLAKAQRTWFKRFQNVQWFDVDEDDTAQSMLEKISYLF